MQWVTLLRAGALFSLFLPPAPLGPNRGLYSFFPIMNGAAFPWVLRGAELNSSLLSQSQDASGVCFRHATVWDAFSPLGSDDALFFTRCPYVSKGGSPRLLRYFLQYIQQGNAKWGVKPPTAPLLLALLKISVFLAHKKWETKECNFLSERILSLWIMV